MTVFMHGLTSSRPSRCLRRKFPSLEILVEGQRVTVMKRHLIAAGIVVAVVAMVVPLWVNEGPLWRLVMLERVCFEDLEVGARGWSEGTRWGKKDDPPRVGRSVAYWITSGYKCRENWWRKDSELAIQWPHLPTETVWIRGRIKDNKRDGVWTWWGESGRVQKQMIYRLGKVAEERTSAPWLNEVTDQFLTPGLPRK